MARGLDHLVVAVNDLDAAGQAYEALGFTVTPENRHPWGTANRLVQLDGFFLEFLSVAEPDKIPSPQGSEFSFGAFNRDFLRKREGASMLVLESAGAAGDRQAFETAGLTLFDPFSFERVANLPDGSTAKVAFDLTLLQDPASPGLGYFTCDNRYPENFWKPAFQAHANGAHSVLAVHMAANNPAAHAPFLKAFSGGSVVESALETLVVTTPRGQILVHTQAAYSALTGKAAASVGTGDLPVIAAVEIASSKVSAPHITAADALFGLTVILVPATCDRNRSHVFECGNTQRGV